MAGSKLYFLYLRQVLVDVSAVGRHSLLLFVRQVSVVDEADENFRQTEL